MGDKHTPTYVQLGVMEKLPKRYGSTNQTLCALERRGLVRLVTDGRPYDWYPFWHLTDKGRNLLGEVKAAK